MRPPSSRWISIQLTSNPTSFYLTPHSALIQLQVFLASPSTALFLFLNNGLRRGSSFFLVSTPYAVTLLLHEAFLSFVQSISSAPSHLFFTFISVTKLERLRRAASRTIASCFLSSSILFFLSVASLLLRVILTHLALSSYEQNPFSPNFLSYFRFGQTWS